MKNNWFKLILLTVGVAIFANAATLVCSVQAVSNNEIVDKALIYDLKSCYDNKKFAKEIKYDAVYSTPAASGGKMPLPNYFSDKDNINCDEVMKRIYGSNSNSTAMLQAFGYKPEATTDRKCIKYAYKKFPAGQTTSTDVFTPTVCAEVDTDGKIKPDTVIISDPGNDPNLMFSYNGTDLVRSYNGRIVARDPQGNVVTSQEIDLASISFGNTTWDDFVKNFNKTMGEFNKTTGGASTMEGIKGETYLSAGGKESQEKGVPTKYVLEQDAFSKTKYASKLKPYSKTEQVYTYQKYLEKLESEGKIHLSCPESEDGRLLLESGRDGIYTKVHIAQSSGYNEGCYVKIISETKLNGFNADGSWSKEVSIADIVNFLKDTTLTAAEIKNLGDAAIDDPDTGFGGSMTPSPDQSTSPSELDECMTIGGAMGWIVCPALQALKSALETVYDYAIVPLLQVKSEAMSRNSGTYAAWSIFRNIANIVFVILILVVIFSQVTGYGIDNYGIKRMLPRLIVMAILLNFSFIICQLAVDVSNILGAGFNNFFVSISEGSLGDVPFEVIGENGDIVIKETVAAGPGFFGNILGLAFDFIGVVALGSLAFTIFTGTGILLSLLVSFLGAIVSVIFMFVSLGVRLAGVVILTVLAPLAFVAYALPNTNPLFKKWFNTFKALLLLYPICGLLVGGGQFAATILLKTLPQTSENAVLRFFYVIIAIMLSVVPFFALPALLRRTVSALGGAGATLAGLGARLRGATTSGIRNSEAYKRRVTQMNANSARRVAGAMSFGANQRGWRRLASAPIRALGRSRQATAAANITAGETLAKRDRAATAMLQNMSDDRGAAQLAADFSMDASEDEMSVMLDRISGMDMKEATELVSSKLAGLDIVNSAADRQRFERLSAAVKNNEKLYQAMGKEEDAKRMIDGRGYFKDANGNVSLGNLASHTAAFARGAETKDLAGLSSKALRRLTASNELDKNVVLSTLRSSDPAIQSGLLSDSGKRGTLESYVASELSSMANTQLDVQKMRRDEEDAARRGLQQLSLDVDGSGPQNIQGYMPSSFNINNATVVRQDINTRDIIVRDNTTGQEWNVSTGRYVGGPNP